MERRRYIRRLRGGGFHWLTKAEISFVLGGGLAIAYSGGSCAVRNTVGPHNHWKRDTGCELDTRWPIDDEDGVRNVR